MMPILVPPPTRKDFEEHEARCTLAVMFCGQRIPFETVDEASGVIREMITESGMGASQTGSMFEILDKSGKEVGFVTYNGRVFEGTRNEWKTAKQIYPPTRKTLQK